MSDTPSARAIREQLGHPVIDIDGHLIEFMPAVAEYLRDELGPGRFEAYRRASQWRARSEPATPSVDQLRDQRRPRYAWWGLPAENTWDRATAMLPALLYERVDELGVHFECLPMSRCTSMKGSSGGSCDKVGILSVLSCA